jgi:hypothetical protein
MEKHKVVVIALAGSQSIGSLQAVGGALNCTALRCAIPIVENAIGSRKADNCCIHDVLQPPDE